MYESLGCNELVELPDIMFLSWETPDSQDGSVGKLIQLGSYL